MPKFDLTCADCGKEYPDELVRWKGDILVDWDNGEPLECECGGHLNKGMSTLNPVGFERGGGVRMRRRPKPKNND